MIFRIGGEVRCRAKLVQSKTGTPVQFELTPQTRDAIESWRRFKGLEPQGWLFSSRKNRSRHITTRQYSRIIDRWVTMIGLPKSAYGTHSMPRTKATIIYRKTGNVRAVQLLVGHTKLDSTVRYLGVELDDALELAESTEL